MRQKSLFTRIYLFFTLLLIPAFGVYEGLAYFAANRKNIEISAAAQNLVKIRSDLKLHADESAFWVNRLTTFFAESAAPENFAASINGFLKKFPAKLEFAVYSPAGKLIADNLDIDAATRAKWQEAGPELKQMLELNQSSERYRAIDRLRPLFGQNFFIPDRGNDEFCVATLFYKSDFENDRYRYWAAGNRQMLVVARMPTGELRRRTGFRHFAAVFSAENVRFARFAGTLPVKCDEKDAVTARIAFNRLRESPGSEFIEFDNQLFSRVQIDAGVWILIMYDLPKSGARYGYLVVAGLMILGCGFFAMRNYGYFPGRIENLSLLVQICVLMAISAGIPLVILGSVAVNYFSSKETALIREKNQEMVRFALQIDRNIQLEYARYSRLIRQSVRELPEAFRKEFSPGQIIGTFREKLGEVFSNVQIMRTTLTDSGNSLGRTGNRSADYQVIVSDMAQGDREIVEYLGKEHLAALNRVSPPAVPAEKAVMLELIFQKPVEMIVSDLLAVEGNTTEAGWGMRKVTLFAEAFKVLTRSAFDHYVLVSIVSELLHQSYIMRHLHGAIRNPWGFTFYVARDRTLFNEQKALELFPEINRLFMRVSDYPLPEPEIVDFQGQNCLFVGLRGSMAANVRFCVLYPVARIRQEIRAEAEELLYPAALGGTIVLFMILVLYLNLLLPVNRLHQAARALETRDAAFRLPETRGGDEFAEMATIFNASIAEFEELKIASIVQTRLLPSKPLNVKGYSIFGKCLPMVELGGDYYDYFPVDDENFVLLLGDVAGHGVGASLLMAMAKAGVVCGSDVFKDPAAMLSRLHQIIFSIKNRVQRKVMTFQYLLVNSSGGNLTYANAGGCSPVIVDPAAGTVVELKHGGPVLGGFKKTSYSNFELKIKPGQAMILYTDGMVESRNDKGIELGYQGLYDLLVPAFNADADIFYHNILSAYRNWLGQAITGDDMTMIVLVCV